MNSDTNARRSLWKGPASVTAAILLILLLANHFVDGWNWPPKAFVLFALLIFGISLTYELVTRNADTLAYRSAVGIALASGFVLFWGNFVQAADDVNPVPGAMMYLVVPIVGIVGAVLVRFRPHGMARTMFVTTLAQALLLVIAVTRNPPMTIWTGPVWRGFAGNALFAMLFAGSALLFRTAARANSGPRTV
jgi:hypothetical protein